MEVTRRAERFLLQPQPQDMMTIMAKKIKKYSHVESDKFSRRLNHVFAFNWANAPPYLGLKSPSLAPCLWKSQLLVLSPTVLTVATQRNLCTRMLKRCGHVPPFAFQDCFLFQEHKLFIVLFDSQPYPTHSSDLMGIVESHRVDQMITEAAREWTGRHQHFSVKTSVFEGNRPLCQSSFFSKVVWCEERRVDLWGWQQRWDPPKTSTPWATSTTSALTVSPLFDVVETIHK